MTSPLYEWQARTPAEQDAIARNTPEALIDRLGVAMTELMAAVQHNTSQLGELVAQVHETGELIAQLQEIGATLIRIEQKLVTSGEARSSVEIATSTRGYDVKVKSYEHSDVADAGNAAVDEYLRVRAEIERRLLNGEAK